MSRLRSSSLQYGRGDTLLPMTTPPNESDVIVASDRDSISASLEVDASPDVVFDIVSRPENHERISGDATVKGNRFGPEQLGAVGEKFGMSMKMFGIPYRMTSTVKEFEADRLISWAHPGGHLWRWTIEPVGDGRCRIEERFDLETSKVGAPLRLLGFPERHRENVVRSVLNLAEMARG